ncbi:YybH family protein [Litorimonas sp. WD9-15]|uniref:YybH family protein n=1 Tax=Litorimonas sp. WD9-15 TaxID=3418716 RepID=UPI003D061029
MMKSPRNLLIFAVLGGIVGTGVGWTLHGLISKASTAFDPVDIVTVMDDQEQAWNSGDIETFMAGYHRSEALRFASGGKINMGWQATLDGYLSRYPDRATMGELAFTDLEVQVLGEDNALVFGRWALERKDDRPNGLFTLHFQRIDGDWVIVSDHTSSAK